MVCFHPQLAEYKKGVDGRPVIRFIHKKRKNVDGSSLYHDFKSKDVYESNGELLRTFYKQIYLPCGKCLGCRLDNSKDKAIRAMKHLQMHDNVGLFITLTYDDKKIIDKIGYLDDRPVNLHKEDFVLFMKRLREYFPDVKMSYIHCGEYGEKKGRAHHHFILYGLDKFGDEVSFTQRARHSRGYYNYSVSETLDKLWQFGNCIISDVSYNTCRYVSSYIMKKTLGKGKAYLERENEYYTCSKGIGKSWFEQYYKDVFPADVVVYKDNERYKSCKPGKYFVNLLKDIDEELYDEVKAKRALKMLEHIHDDDEQKYKRLSYQEAKSVQIVYAKQLAEQHEDLHSIVDDYGCIRRGVSSAFGIPLDTVVQNEYLRREYLKLFD